MSTFASELQAAIGTNLSVGFEFGGSNDGLDQLRTLLASPDSLRRRIALRILERRATAYVHGQPIVFSTHPETDAIDWSAIPWSEIIVGLLKVLLMILPFIL